MKTRVTELLGVQYPIILGGLQWLGRAKLAAAVSEAGGLGLITAGCFANKQELLTEIEHGRKLTTKPLGLNISIGMRREMDEFFEGAIEAGVDVVFTSGHSPEVYVNKLKEAGVRLVHVVPSVRYAKKAEALGADAVVIVGFEAGGHPGMDDVSLMSLIPKAVKLLKIPVIAAGAIVDGKGLAAALALGAEGVQIGTRFVATKESEAHYAVKEAILRATEVDTTIVLRSINRALRVLKTGTSKKVLAMEKNGLQIEKILKFAGSDSSRMALCEGELSVGLIAIGQGVGLIDEILSVKEVVQNIMTETEDRIFTLSEIKKL